MILTLCYSPRGNRKFPHPRQNLQEEVKDLLWALGVERQRDVAQLADVEGRGFGGDGLPLAAVLVRLQHQALLLGLDLLGRGGPDHRAVLVQLVLQPLDQLVLLVQLQLQLVDQGVALPQLLDLLLQSVLQVPQRSHGLLQLVPTGRRVRVAASAAV